MPLFMYYLLPSYFLPCPLDFPCNYCSLPLWHTLYYLYLLFSSKSFPSSSSFHFVFLSNSISLVSSQFCLFQVFVFQTFCPFIGAEKFAKPTKKYCSVLFSVIDVFLLQTLFVFSPKSVGWKGGPHEPINNFVFAKSDSILYTWYLCVNLSIYRAFHFFHLTIYRSVLKFDRLSTGMFKTLPSSEYFNCKEFALKIEKRACTAKRTI